MGRTTRTPTRSFEVFRPRATCRAWGHHMKAQHMLGLGSLTKKGVRAPPTTARSNPSAPLVAKINALESRVRGEIRHRDRGQDRRVAWPAHKAGEDLDDLLPEAFANCREAARRALGLRAHDVQLIGGIFLHQGNIAEMKTGEGQDAWSRPSQGLPERADGQGRAYSSPSTTTWRNAMPTGWARSIPRSA